MRKLRHSQRKPLRSHQPRPQQPQQPQQPQRPWPQHVTVEGSLHSLLLQHSKRLWVHPLQWTALHLSVLCCMVIDDPLNADHCRLRRGPWKELALELWKKLRGLRFPDDRNSKSRSLIKCLCLNVRPDCQIGPGSLALRYNKKPVCNLPLPIMAWNNKTSLWAYIDSHWIVELHRAYKPRQNQFVAKKKRAVDEKDLPISPFLVAVILAMAQQATAGQQVTLFLLDHELSSEPGRITSTFYEYTFQASHTYLSKFDQSYDAFESQMTIHRRVIPLEQNMLKVLADAVQRATTGSGDQADTVAYTDSEAAITNSPYPVDSTKRKALDESDSNILVKR